MTARPSPEHRSSPSIDEELIERAADAMWRCEGFPDALIHASEESQDRLKHMARAALREVLSDRAKLEEALRRLEVASTTIASRLDMLSIGTEIGCAIEQARAALNRSTDRLGSGRA